jgi:hypothetical protein
MKKKITQSGIIVFVIQFLLMQASFGSDYPNTIDETRVGTLKGRVIDAESKLPLTGTTIMIDEHRGSVADAEGYFRFIDIPVGNYIATIRHLGYETIVITDIIVRSQRITFVEAEMRTTVYEGEEVAIRSGVFSTSDSQPISAINMSYEEIRRAPGSLDDINRAVGALPSVARVTGHNSLIIRGGSPVENGYVIDFIEVPNISHFPVQGSSEGAISMLNMDFIRDVNFYTGGFSAGHGDRLSSIMELNFREGNRFENDVQLDMSFLGLRATLEGPMANGRGSWLFSARRSYLDFLVEQVMDDPEDWPVIPVFGDYQLKLTYDVSPRNKISILGIGGNSTVNFDPEQARNMHFPVYGDMNIAQNTSGVSWRYLWQGNGYSMTSVSHTIQQHRLNYFDIMEPGSEVIRNRSSEQTYSVRNMNFYRFN